ncbi:MULTISPECIES: dephospho-CoA kinase [unclassified Tenacibaculum]|uniref:dephospho-CoA kinase n=1 Tax=unclassified Tenacibaculum TaxID=2635139 RepID=UPI001EEAB6B5|nr:MULTISPECIES: dephospho-CoA kinase [unclassified Tenacibaculum]MCF2874342.1 dephospho-CoA kinase [Tenacibaculum sp. Cn5-1]MCF2934923.1 dephospho-CoA kinase [Tenacibaculum sp. Cn5-34]MCG7511133.1 dephospho-CoA kinase [Tenacibaculum sp. Cn5-46]
MVVGLTGGIGSGKSTILKMFSKFENVAMYIADEEAKKLMTSSQEIKSRLITEFGEETYQNNQLNRQYLANIVFKNKSKLTKLNSIVHPVVNKHLQNFIDNNSKKKYILYENAILFENGSNHICDKIITVTAPENIRIERVLKRDNSNIEDVKSRIKNQWNQTKKTLQSHYIIENLTINKSNEQVFKIHNNLTKNLW